MQGPKLEWNVSNLAPNLTNIFQIIVEEIDDPLDVMTWDRKCRSTAISPEMLITYMQEIGNLRAIRKIQGGEDIWIEEAHDAEF